MSISTLSALQGYGSLDGLAGKAADKIGKEGAAQDFAAIFDNADGAVKGFAAGGVDAQSVVEALAQTEMALQTAVTVRDRLVGAYQELLRMPM